MQGPPPVVIESYDPAWPMKGALAMQELHKNMCAFAKSSTTFDEFFKFANDQIRSRGFENLDFLGNVRHSIQVRRSDRLYIEAGNTQSLGSVEPFTLRASHPRDWWYLGFQT